MMATTATAMPIAAHWPLLRPLDVEPGDVEPGDVEPGDVEPEDEGSASEEEEDEVLVGEDGTTPMPGVGFRAACVC